MFTDQAIKLTRKQHAVCAKRAMPGYIKINGFREGFACAGR